jgi:lipoate-protein ligase B
LHGLAINLNPNMDHFNLIVPCGLAGRPVVSIAEVLGADDAPGMDALGDVLMGQLERCLRGENQYHTDA